VASVEPSELPAAVEAVTRSLAGEVRRYSLRRLLTKWTVADPGAAIAYVGSLPESALRRTGLETVLETWVTRDPEAVAREFERVPPSTEKEKLGETLLQRLAAESPDKALAMMDRYGDSLPAWQRRMALVRGWAVKDPAAAGAYALANGGADYLTVESVARTWAASDPRAAVAWAKSIPSIEDGSRLAASLAVMTYPADPTLALELAGSLPEGNERMGAFQCMMDSALKRSLEEARRLLDLVPEGQTRTCCVVAVATEMAPTDPRGAVDLIEAQVPTPEKEMLLYDALGRWAHVEPNGAVDWALRHITNADLRMGVINKALTVWSTRNPEEAMAFVATMSEGPERSSSVQGVVYGWGESDPVAALAWAGQHLDSTALEPVDWVIHQWSGRDRAGVEEWLQSQENGAVRDRAVAAFSEALEQGDPMGALKWALTLPDLDVRAARTERAAAAWLRTDREAATRWISTSGLSEEAKARLIRP
jgi:hypothetical protein